MFAYCQCNPVMYYDSTGTMNVMAEIIGGGGDDTSGSSQEVARTNSISYTFQDEAVSGSGSITLGYSEVMYRGQGNSKLTSGSQSSITLGAFEMKANASLGVGGGFVLRVKPPQ